MLPLGHRIAFGIFALITLVLGARGLYRLYKRIMRGSVDTEQRADRPLQRLWYALRATLLQKRVFRRRRVLGVFHSFIFYAFVLYLLVNLLDALGGYIEFDSIRFPVLVGVYGALTDTFSALAIVGVLVFVLRRYSFRSRIDFGFNDNTLLHPKVRQGYIQRDSLIVSAFILFHVGSRVIANAAHLAIAGTTKTQPFSSALAPLFAGPHAAACRMFGYWGALGSVLAFLAYFPYTKHIHLIAAPVKYFFHRRSLSGTMPMAKIDLDAAEPQIGVMHLADLSQPRLLDAYACIQCNRCQDVCPASGTGKALSPAALEINKRMVLNTITEEKSALALTGLSGFEQGAAAGPTLLEAVIPQEAVWACTTCGACMEVCPTQDEQMLDILDLRRNLVMVQGEFPTQLQATFRGMERSSNPWGLARDKRMEWAAGLQVPTIDLNPDPDVLYWVGCAASYDPSAGKTARAVVQLLAEASVNFAVLGKRECCTGDSARRAGNELLYQQLAGEAINVLREARPRLVLASCPHCVNTIANEFPQLGGSFTVMHHTEYLASLVDRGRLKPLGSEARITFHDPCYLGRHRGTFEEPRSILRVLSNDYVELPRTKSNAFCCGAGGAQFWKEEEPGRERISESRFREAQHALAPAGREGILAVGCPFCKSMLQSTPAAGKNQNIAVKDVAEILWEGIQRNREPAFAGKFPLENIASDTARSIDSSERTALFQQPGPTVVVSSAPAIEIASETSASASVAVTEEASSDAAVQPPSRKKWTPHKGSQDGSPWQEVTLSETGSQVPMRPANEPSTPAIEEAPARKKWIPASTSPPALDTAFQDPTKSPGVAVPPSPERKKWKPGGVS